MVTPGGDLRLREQPGAASPNSPFIEMLLHHRGNSQSRRLLAQEAPREQLAAPRNHLARGWSARGVIGDFGESWQWHRSKAASSNFCCIATTLARAAHRAPFRGAKVREKAPKLTRKGSPRARPRGRPPPRPLAQPGFIPPTSPPRAGRRLRPPVWGQGH